MEISQSVYTVGVLKSIFNEEVEQQRIWWDNDSVMILDVTVLIFDNKIS